jgi:hypothetical protein
MMMGGNISDNDSLPDAGGPATGSPGGGRDPQVAAALTPEQQQQQQQFDAEDMMAAAMEVNANQNGRHRDPTGDQALMGANNDDGNVEGLEATDENGELVRQEFTKFLQQ